MLHGGIRGLSDLTVRMTTTDRIRQNYSGHHSGGLTLQEVPANMKVELAKAFGGDSLQESFKSIT